MPKATLDDGSLIPIRDCYIVIPIDGGGKYGLSQGQNEITITLDILPDISDSK